MNDEQLNTLFFRARQAPGDTSRAEYGFETRLMARLREDRHSSSWTLWTWRLMPYFAAAAVAAGCWSYVVQTDISVELALAGTDSCASLTRTLTGEYYE